MGETASARPARLVEYERRGAARTRVWDTEVPALRDSLAALRRALSGDLPPGSWVYVAPLDLSLSTLARDVEHLDEWVGDVGRRFARADGGLFGLGALFALIDDRRLVTLDADDVALGPADRDAAEALGRADAADLAALLEGESFLTWYDISNDPDRLEDLASRYPALRDMVQRIASHQSDEDYLVALFEALGADRVQLLGDVVNQLGLAADWGYLRADAFDEFVVPLAGALSAAEQSGRLDPDVLAGLFEFGPGESEGQDAEYLEEMRRRSLALLLYAGDFSSPFTAEAANAITTVWPVTNHLHNYEGFSSGLPVMDGRPELASTEWMTMTVLAGDDHAANLYLAAGNIPLLVHMNVLPGEYNVVAGRLGADFTPDYYAAVADVLEGGLFRYPLSTGTTYSPATASLVADMVQTAGQYGVEDPIKRALALISAPFTGDLAIATQSDRDDLPPGRLDVSPEEVFAFFKELSFDDVARQTLATNAAAYLSAQIGDAAPDIAREDPHAVGTETRLAVALYVTLGQAMHEAMDDVLAEREALVSAWRTLTDPIVDLVSGRIVQRIPGAQLPVIRDIVSGATNSLESAVNSAIYDNLVPVPEVERLSSWEEALGPAVRDAIAHALYDAPETRAALGGAGFDGTFEEFRALDHVQDVVNQYSEDIITGFDAEIAFDELFG